MRLPNLQKARVEEQKVVAYLLSDERSEGKAAFFVSFGFSLSHWELLKDALLTHAASHEVVRTLDNPHGAKYIIEGPLTTPDGRNPLIRSVWIIEIGSDAPRLVTAYPL